MRRFMTAEVCDYSHEFVLIDRSTSQIDFIVAADD